MKKKIEEILNIAVIIIYFLAPLLLCLATSIKTVELQEQINEIRFESEYSNYSLEDSKRQLLTDNIPEDILIEDRSDED